MITAAERLAALDNLPATELCRRALSVLDSLVTTMLRAGRFRETGPVTAEKTALAQDYVGLVRSIQRQTGRLLKEAPDDVRLLRAGHERLATQMAENLRVLATARTVTDEILTDVAQAVGERSQAKTYGAGGEVTQNRAPLARGIAINRAL